MKIGENEVADTLIESELKTRGMRIVKDEDYISKAEQSAVVAKMRSLLGDKMDSPEKLAEMVKAYEEHERSSKSQLELAVAQAKELEKALLEERGRVQQAKLEMRKRDVDAWFAEGMEVTGVKVMEPILGPFKQDFLKLKDEEIQNVEFLKGLVVDRITKASEIQKDQLARLGLNGISSNDSRPTSFGGGDTNFQTKQSPGMQIQNPNDLFEIQRKGAASPVSIPIFGERKQ